MANTNDKEQNLSDYELGELELEREEKERLEQEKEWAKGKSEIDTMRDPLEKKMKMVSLEELKAKESASKHIEPILKPTAFSDSWKQSDINTDDTTNTSIERTL